jgi:hypothetical protein
MPKATKATVQLRIEQVAEILIAGGGPKDVMHFASEKDAATGRPWRVSERQLGNYIERATSLLAQDAEEDRDKRFRLAIAQRQALYARAFEGGDWRTCLAILKDRDELWQLYPSSLSELAAEVERLKQLVEEYRRGTRKANPGNGQAESNGGGHTGRNAVPDSERLPRTSHH